MENNNAQKVNSDISPKRYPGSWLRYRFCTCCGCVLLVPLLPIILIMAVVLCNQIVESFLVDFDFSTVRFVELHEIPDIKKELSGEWVILLPRDHDIWWLFNTGMRGWRQTRFILNEDGTCEIHNLTLAMTNPYMGFRTIRRYPEWTNRKIAGVWEVFHTGAGRDADGRAIRIPIIIIHGETERTLENRFNCYCSIRIPSWATGMDNRENIEWKSGCDENDFYCSGYIQVWKVKEKGKETYRLRMLGDPWDAELFDAKSGIILRRVE